jgi:transcription antitermination factor NusG
MSKKTEIADLLRQIASNHSDAESMLSNASDEVSGIEYEIGMGDLESCPEPKDADEARDGVAMCENTIGSLQDVVYKLEEICSSLNDSISNLEELQSDLEEIADLYDEEEDFEEGDTVQFTEGLHAGSICKVLSVHENRSSNRFAWVIGLTGYGEPMTAKFSELERYEP